jgi:hypothetical protein
MQRLSRWFRDHSLWIVSLGLMLASSGIDGAYMAKWMPLRFGWLGLVLNTMSDISGMVLVYWYGRLQQDRSSRKRRLSNVLVAAEVVAVLYSWFFSWRQLRAVLPQYEEDDWKWVASISAGFIPLLLAFVGYAQSLLAGRIEDLKVEKAPAQVAQKVPAAAEDVRKPKATIDDWRKLVPTLNGQLPELSATDVAEILEEHGYALPSSRTLSHWARVAREEEEEP